MGWAMSSLWNRHCPGSQGPLPSRVGFGSPCALPLQMTYLPGSSKALNKHDLGDISPEATETCPNLSDSWDEHKLVCTSGTLSPLNSDIEQCGWYSQSYEALLPKDFFKRKTM